MKHSYDLVVIGGGAAGLVAAREARRRGASVVIVQSGRPGGDCTFTGCVPSKSLLSAAGAGLAFDAAMTRMRATIEDIAATEDSSALARHGIDVVDGFARFVDRRTVEVGGERIRSERFVVATGSRPALPPIDGLAAADPLTNESLFAISARPASMIIMGGGPIGCEMAQAFARFGTRVTLIEALDRLLPREEPEASALVAEALSETGVDVRLGQPVERVERERADGPVAVTISDGSRIVGATLLVAVGRVPAGRGLGLEDVGVAVDRNGAVCVDSSMATTVRGIWAAGDVTGGLQFTHAAGRMGWIAASNSLAKLARVRAFRFDASRVPWATFTTPEVGRVGMTEAQAAAEFPDARVAHLPLADLDRAILSGQTRGFVKLIAARRRVTGHLGGGQLIGATIVAPNGGDLIHEAALALQTRMFVGRLAQTTHAYPSWASGIQQAALQFFGPTAGHRCRPVEGNARLDESAERLSGRAS